MREMAVRLSRVTASALVLWGAGASAAAPPAPSGAHPRLFMSAANISVFAAQAGTAGTSSKALVNRCQDSINNPGNYVDRSANLDSDVLWSGMSCWSGGLLYGLRSVLQLRTSVFWIGYWIFPGNVEY